jgi:beta-mannanase
LRPAPRHCRRPKHAAPRHLRGGSAKEPGSHRRILLTASLVAALIAALAFSARALAPTPAPGERGGTVAGAMLGMYVRPVSGWSQEAQQAGVSSTESRLGRKLAIDHLFLPWAARPSRWLWRADWDLRSGRLPLITFGSRVDTRQIVAGDHDAYLASLADSMRALGKPVLLRYAPEPDVAGNQSWVHSGDDYVAAWRHVRGLFAGVRGSWVWSPSAGAFAGARGGVERYWPGDGQVDWIGADGFNRGGCSQAATWQELADIFQPFYAWGSTRSKPLMIADAATAEDPADPGRKARWFDSAARALQAMPRIKAIVYHSSSSGCDWRVGSGGASWDGFSRLAQDPWLQMPPSTLADSVPSPGPSTTLRPPTTTKPPATTRPPTTTAPPVTTQPPIGGGVSGKLVPRNGVLWGSSNVSDDLEAKLGRRLDISHTYHDWDDRFPNAAEQARAGHGSILFLDWMPRVFGTTKIVPWNSVANGSQDAVIDATADRLKAFGRPLFLSFHHEPENEVGQYGSASDFAAAFRHVHDRFAARGVGNVVWVWNVMGWSGGYGQYTGGLYPGDAYVDWIAWDPYNWYGCRGSTWTSFGDKAGQFYGWLKSNGFGDKPFMLGEYGTPERSGDPGAKAAWFGAIPSALQTRLTNLKALVYFNHPGNIGCIWRIDSSSAALQAFAQVGQTSLMKAR